MEKSYCFFSIKMNNPVKRDIAAETETLIDILEFFANQSSEESFNENLRFEQNF